MLACIPDEPKIEMLGYLLGGALVDRTMSPRLCGALLVFAGVYLFSIPWWVDALFAWMIANPGDGLIGTVSASMALLLLPVPLPNASCCDRCSPPLQTGTRS